MPPQPGDAPGEIHYSICGGEWAEDRDDTRPYDPAFPHAKVVRPGLVSPGRPAGGNQEFIAGKTMQVAFEITVNHGGAYAYFALPRAKYRSETDDDFMRNWLPWVDPDAWGKTTSNNINFSNCSNKFNVFCFIHWYVFQCVFSFYVCLI